MTVVCCRERRVVCCLRGHSARVTAVAFAPEAPGLAPWLVAGCEDGSLRCWSVQSAACTRSQKKRGPEVTAIAILDG